MSDYSAFQERVLQYSVCDDADCAEELFVAPSTAFYSDPSQTFLTGNFILGISGDLGHGSFQYGIIVIPSDREAIRRMFEGETVTVESLGGNCTNPTRLHSTAFTDDDGEAGVKFEFASAHCSVEFAMSLDRAREFHIQVASFITEMDAVIRNQPSS